jgi:drug/metabolite transporter (DMT)-like permease
MKYKKPLTAAVFFFLVCTDILETAAQFCFKKAALLQNSGGLLSVLTSPLLWLALLTVFVLFCIWSTVLSKVDLSVAVPIASLSYITIPLVSVIFLGEHVSFLRWLGIGFVILGIILVSMSTRKEAA